MAKYLHRMHIVEAHQVPDHKGGEPHDFHEWADKVGLAEGMGDYYWEQDGTLVLETGRGATLTAIPGDWVVMDLGGDPHIYRSDNFKSSLVSAESADWHIDERGNFEAIKGILADDLVVKSMTLGPNTDKGGNGLDVSDDHVTIDEETSPYIEVGEEINWGTITNNSYEVDWGKVNSLQAIKDILAAQHMRFYPTSGKVEEDFPKIHRYLRRVGEGGGDEEPGCNEIPLDTLVESVPHMDLDTGTKAKLIGSLISTFRASDIISRNGFISVFYDLPGLRAHRLKAVECWVKASNYKLDKQGVA